MKTTKITIFSTLGVASLVLLISACGNAANTTTNSSTSNTVNKSNTAVVNNSNQTTVNNTANVSNTAPTPAADQSEASEVQGELQVGKTESVILYVGMESGDYAGYCFTNDSEAGRAILAACKDKEQCSVKGTVDHEAGCKVPGLEADLSDSGKITKVETVKSLGKK